MKNFSKKRIFALFGFMMLVIIATGVFIVFKYDKYKGLINIKSSELKLLSDVSLATNIHGTDEVNYEVKYTLDKIDGVKKRDVVLKGELKSEYARFKGTNNSKITSEVTNDGKNIVMTIKDVPLGKEQTVKFKINVLNAPNKEEIKPIIDIKESTGEYARLDTDTLTVETNSVEGVVYDENNLKVKNIELSILKDDKEVKRTYTNTEGRFIFSDLEEGNYTVRVEEDIYELSSDSRTTENNENLILKVNEADKFNIEIHKYISNLKLVVDGKENNYSYDDVDKVVRSIKKFNNVSGEIEYKLVVKNNSDKNTKIKELVDSLGEGLSFDKSKNPGWEVIDNKIKFLPVEDVILSPYEKREYKITIDIVNTKELKTYINKLTTKGEINNKVVFILDGKEIRNINVIEGNKITKPELDKEIIWYTDINKTNQYNFNNSVTKDLILYGDYVKEEPDPDPIINVYTVTYLDQGNLFYEEEVEENSHAEGITDIPAKPHNIFIGWYLNDSLFDFDTLIAEDITLESKYEEVEAPSINRTPDGWTNNGLIVSISSDHDDYTYMYKIGDGNYTLYTGPFALNENDTIYAYSIKNGITSLETTLVIDTIDKINPTIVDSEITNITPISARLNLSILDEQSGLDKYRVYIDNVLVFESLSYVTNPNDEKNETYFISNLDELNTYVIKLEVIDKVGNKTSYEHNIDTPSKHYVARVLNYNLEEIQKFESLNEAITSDLCLSSCYIEMIDNVIESNIIGQNQNITIDLNGKVITGENNYALYNNGKLNIIDLNENYVGKVYSDNIAIINDGTLIVGINEEEPDVSDTQPIIEGNTSGIKNNSILDYYDGHIIGNVPVDGLVTETPFLHNTQIVETSGGKPETKLNKVADAVARLNSVYYTEAQAAIDKSLKGYEDEVDYTRPLIEQLRSDDNYRFIYDEKAHCVVNDNKYSSNTLAHSYIKLDLTNYTDSQMLTINAEIDNNGNSSSYGYVTITESIDTPLYNQTEGRLIYIKGKVSAKDYSTLLQKGKVYYIHIGYRKDSNNSVSTDTFRVNKITLGNFESASFSNLDEVIMYNDSSYYFEIDENDYYVSNNTGIHSSTAHSYFVVDLTNVNEDKYIVMNAKISSQSSDYGYITVNNNINLPPVTNSAGRQVYISGEQTNKQYIIKLYRNQINVVHLCYYKNGNTNTGEDKFTITSITPYANNAGYYDDVEMVNNGTYYFERQEDGSYKNNNKGVKSSVANSYMLFDLTNELEDLVVTIDVTISSENSDKGYITITDNPIAPLYSSATGRIYFSGGNTTTTVLQTTLSAGKKNYIHFGYRKDSSIDSYNDEFTINSLKILNPCTMDNIDFITTKTDNHSSSETIPVLNQKVETVELVKDVTLSQPLEIVSTRDVILDLNGKSLTTSAESEVINNKGSLKIIDTDFDRRKTINIEYKTEQARLFEQAREKYLADVEEYEEYAGLCDGCEPSEEYLVDQTIKQEIEYSGGEFVYTPHYTGSYKLEVWGAQGGSATYNNTTATGGYGGYSKGIVTLTEGAPIYINVGGQGVNNSDGDAPGGYNGGGACSKDNYGIGGSGGGATHVATKSGLLSTLNNDVDKILIVAGGGAGSGREYSNRSAIGGNGGGFEGNKGINSKDNPGIGGTQTSGGAFGKGPDYGGWYASPGGGFYGGTAGCGSGGGSGYIGNQLLTDKEMNCYECKESNEESTKTVSNTCVNDDPIENCSKIGNGYAKISMVLTDEEIEEMKKNLPKTYNIKTMPVFKDYLTEIDFDDSIDIDEITVDSEVSYNNKVEESVQGNVYSTTYSVILNNYGAYLNIESGNVTLDKSGYYHAINNKGKLTLGENAYVKALQKNNRGIYNNESGDILDGSGTITTEGADSIGILNDSVNDDKIKGYTIKNTQSTSYNFYNQNYHVLELDGITTSGPGTDIYQNADSDLTNKNSKLGSNKSNSYSFYSNESSIESIITFNNCNVLNEIRNRQNSYRKINIINSSLISTSNKKNIYNYNGEITLNNTIIINRSNNVSSIDNNSRYRPNGWAAPVPSIENYGIINISGGSINTEVAKNSNYSFIGIANLTGGTVNINGTFEIKDSHDNGILNYGTLTLGNNSDSVTLNPIIKGKTSAIYNAVSSTFNYYDGTLVGSLSKTLDGIVTSIPDNYDLYVTAEDNKETIVLKSYIDMIADEEYVAAIGMDKYVSIQSAIDSVSESNNPTEITLLRNIETAVNNNIPIGKNISVNQKNHFIKSHNTSSCFTNNGTFELTDDTNNPNYENITFSNLIINNGTANYSNIKSKIITTNKIIHNSAGATMNISNGEIYSTMYKIISNSGYMNIIDTKMSGNAYSTSQQDLLINNSNGSMVLTRCDIKYTYRGPTISNYGNLEIYDSTALLTGDFSATTVFVYNASSGYTKIEGGNYGASNSSNNKKGTLISNASGESLLKNVTSNFNRIAYVSGGTTNIQNGTYNCAGTKTIETAGGTINITGAAINNSSGGGGNDGLIYTTKTSTINITNTNINQTSSNTSNDYLIYPIGSDNESVITITNSTLISNYYTVYLASGSNANITLDIISGTLKSNNKNAIYIVSGTPTINIGVKDGDVSTQNPQIIGKTYGIYNGVTNTTINFYDGVISGETAIYGKMSEFEDGYDIVLNTVDNIEYKTLGLLPLIKNIDKDTTHYTLYDALDKASNNDRLELLREYTSSPAVSVVENNKILTLDLKGHKIQQNNTNLLINNGTLTIKSTEDGGMIESNSSEAIINNGTLNIESGKFNQTTTNYILKNNEGATLNINDGDISTTKTRAIDNYGYLNVNSGNIYSTDNNISMGDSTISLIKNSSTGEIVLDGGTITYSGRGSAINNSGTVESNNPTVNLYGYTSGWVSLTPYITNNSSGYVEITGGNYGKTANNGILIVNAGEAEVTNADSDLQKLLTNTGTLTVTGGDYTFGYKYLNGNRHYIIASGGTLDLSNIKITFENTGTSNTFGDYIIIYNDAEVTITNSIIKNESGTRIDRIIYQYGTSKLDIINSSILANTEIPAIELKDSCITNVISGEVSSSLDIGIKVAGSAQLTIGTHDYNVSTADPIISGKTYGLYNSSTSSTVNFYDGVISGETAIYGKISVVEDEYDIVLNKVDNVEHKTLGLLPLIENIDKNTTHYTLKDAIDKASNNDRLELLREYTSSPIVETVENNKILTLDLKGHKIQQNNANLLINNGTLTVKTSIDGGRIESNSGAIFVNNGTLTIENGKYTQTTSNYVITNNVGATFNITGGEISVPKENSINNSGILNISDAKVYATSNSSYTTLINNTADGEIVINRGEFIDFTYNRIIDNAGRVEANNCIVDIGHSALNESNGTFIRNTSSNSYAKINGGTFGAILDVAAHRGLILTNEAGTADITGFIDNYFDKYSTESGSYSGILVGGGTVNITNATINQYKNNIPIYANGTATINISNSNINLGNTECISLNDYSTANILSGTIKSDFTYAITINGNSSKHPTLNIGTLGGTVSTSDPIIQGKTFSIFNKDNQGRVYFYDGILRGETGVISGAITDYEPGYKEDRYQYTDPETSINYYESKLTVISDDIRAISVGNINFESIQSAVNYAVSNNISRIDLYHDIELSSDLIKPSGINVDIYLNNYQIITGSYTIDSGINLISGNNEPNNNLGASILKPKYHTENIVIYELEDGSELDTTNTYNLYKLVQSNYDIVRVNENRIGNYDIGKDIKELRTVNGRIYINNLSEGTYKLVSSSNKEITFDVLSNGVSSNVRVNDKVTINRIVSVIATVILQIQTGNNKSIYLLLILLIIIVILGLTAIKRHKRI